MDYDVVIVGAGIAGSALACALSAIDSRRTALRIALVEARSLPLNMPPCDSSIDGFDARVSALTSASQHWLESLGLWSGIAAQRSCYFDHMEVWDAEGTGAINFDASEVRAKVLGYIVENRIIISELLSLLRAQDIVHIYDGSAVQNLTLAGEGNLTTDSTTVVELANGKELHSALVVAADGADSPLRGMANLPIREWDYRHDAIVCTAMVEKPHCHTAWQRFTSQGPVAFLPLPSSCDDDKNYCSIVWSQGRVGAASAMALDNVTFCRALSEAFENRLGEVSAVSQRFCFPLRQRHAIDYVQPGFALVADAAHTIHPLAGQGINLGLADVAALSECISAAHRRGQPLGDIGRLRQYQRLRKSDNLAMMAAVEGFKRVFDPQPLPLRWLRNRGMRFLDGRRGIKRRIIRYAMGIS